MRGTTSVILLAVLLLGEPVLRVDASQPKLTTAQVLQLLKVLPDQVLAGEIRDRGMAEAVSRSSLESLQKAGAGPQALRMLRSLILTPTLIVHSNQAGSEVLVDDVLKGTAGPVSPLVIRDEEAGTHAVTVRKRRYSTAQQQIVLKTGKPSEVNLTLELAVGMLSVTTNAPNAQMGIEGVDLPGANVRNVELAPGEYVLHVEAPQFTGVTKNVTLKAGDILQVSVPLTLDPDFVRSLVARAQAALTSQDYASAVRLATAAMQAKPGDADALNVAAMSFFYLRDYAHFTQYGMQAIQAGGTLTIPVVHHHTLMSSHRAHLMLAANTIAYDANGQPGVVCNQPPFQVRFANVRGCDLKQDQRQQVYLNLKVMNTSSNRQQSLMFADYRATAVPDSNGVSILIGPSDGPAELSSVATLVQKLWENR